MGPPPSASTSGRGRRIGIGIVFLWFLIGGIAHFAATAPEMRIVPPWFPWPRFAVLASGVFELLGAAGLLWAATRRAAGIGLFALTLAVTPAHIYMLQVPEQFDVSPVLLWLRLPIQVALLVLIWWCTDIGGRQSRLEPATATAAARSSSPRPSSSSGRRRSG